MSKRLKVLPVWRTCATTVSTAAGVAEKAMRSQGNGFGGGGGGRWSSRGGRSNFLPPGLVPRRGPDGLPPRLKPPPALSGRGARGEGAMTGEEDGSLAQAGRKSSALRSSVGASSGMGHSAARRRPGITR